MVDINNTKDAQSSADKVKAADNGHSDSTGAYKALNSEVQDHYKQIGTNGYTQADFQNYQNTLVKDLVANGTLPDLSLAWANDNKSLLHNLSGSDPDGQQISRGGISSGVEAQQGNTDGTLIQAFGAQLSKDGGDVNGVKIKGGTYDAAVKANGGDPNDGDYLNTDHMNYQKQEAQCRYQPRYAN